MNKKLVVLMIMIILGVVFSEEIYQASLMGGELVLDMLDKDNEEASYIVKVPEEEIDLTESTEELEIQVNTEDIESDYYYNLLSNQEQELYVDMYAAYSNYIETVDLSESYSEMDSTDVHKVHWYVMLDNPDLFWVSEESSVSYVDTEDGRELKSLNTSNNYTEEEIEVYVDLLEAVIEDVLGYTNTGTTDYEKALLVYEYIILHCSYDQDSAEIKLSNSESTSQSQESGTIIGSLINGSAVCAGYAKAFDYILEILEIECFSVVGYADGVGHEWNMIKLNGEYYHVDCTWGDPVSETVDESYITYKYFCLTSQLMNTTHMEMEDIIYPECTSLECNYYAYNGWCFEMYDYEVIASLFKESIEQGNSSISFCFTNEVEYLLATEQLIDTDLGKIITENSNLIESKCSYLFEDELYLITVEITFK